MIVSDRCFLPDSITHEYIPFSADSIRHIGIRSINMSAPFTAISKPCVLHSDSTIGINDTMIIERSANGADGFVLIGNGYYGLSLLFYQKCQNGFQHDSWTGQPDSLIL